MVADSGGADLSWNGFDDGDGGDSGLMLYLEGESVDELMKIDSSVNDNELPDDKQLQESPNGQEKMADEGCRKDSLGLKLTITPYLISSWNNILSLSPSQEINSRPTHGISPQSHEANSHSRHRIHHHHRHHHHSHQRTRHDEYNVSQPSEKLKAANFPALSLKIGSWERVTIHEGDLVAKCYYAKKKLVWEFLEGTLKRKVEIQWDHISAIKATLNENSPGILQIELTHPPAFSDEIDPQPRKHTNWKTTQDFTGGQALLYRVHCLTFPAGVLDKHYEKLLQHDGRLFQLSQQPFPSSNFPYFPQLNQNMHDCGEHTIDFNIHDQQQLLLQPAYQQMINPLPFHFASQDSVIDGSMCVGNQMEFRVQEANSRDQPVQGYIPDMAAADTTSFVYQNHNNNCADMLSNEIDSNSLINYLNQQYYQDSATSMHPYHYQVENPVGNIATNQHLSYEQDTAAAIHAVNQQHYSADIIKLHYPPQSFSWMAQPAISQPAATPQHMAQPMMQPTLQPMAQAVGMPTLPHNMVHSMSMAAMHQNMTQPASMATLPQNVPYSNSHDGMIDEFYHHRLQNH